MSSAASVDSSAYDPYELQQVLNRGSKGDKYPIVLKGASACFNYLSPADQQKIAGLTLAAGNALSAAGYELRGRSFGKEKKYELILYAIGTREKGTNVIGPVKKGECPYDVGPVTDSLARRFVSLSKNILIVSGACKSNILACTPNEVVALLQESEYLLADVSSLDEFNRLPDDRRFWSGAIHSQVGLEAGQTVNHAHIHVTKGVKPREEQ